VLSSQSNSSLSALITVCVFLFNVTHNTVIVLLVSSLVEDTELHMEIVPNKALSRYCVDISVYHRYIGDESVYRRSFKDKFVTIRTLGDYKLRNRRLHC